MRIIGRLFLAIALLIVLVIGAAYLLPKEVTVARTATISAPAEDIYPFLIDYREFNKWSPWLEKDPDTVVEYEGEPSGVGHRMRWDSGNPDVGSGVQEIMEVDAGRYVRTAIDFGSMGTAIAEFILEPDGSQTKLTWRFTTDLGLNPAFRYMGLMMDRWVGQDYEMGLAKLKDLVEKDR